MPILNRLEIKSTAYAYSVGGTFNLYKSMWEFKEIDETKEKPKNNIDSIINILYCQYINDGVYSVNG